MACLPPPGWGGPDCSPLIVRLWDDGTLRVSHMSCALSGVTHFCLKQSSKDSKPTLEITVAVADKEQEDKAWRLMGELKKLPIESKLVVEEVK